MTTATERADMAACHALLKGGSRTFHAASQVLPRRVADPAIALYAFCRLADDEVDLGGDRGAAVERLKERLDRAYRGHPMNFPADRAFADVVVRFSIPRELPEALLEGLPGTPKAGATRACRNCMAMRRGSPARSVR